MNAMVKLIATEVVVLVFVYFICECELEMKRSRFVYIKQCKFT